MEITSSAFNGCHALTKVNLGNTLTYIGSSAFKNCDGLVSVVIPETVDEICGNAFADCKLLSSVTIPHSANAVLLMDKYIFSDSPNVVVRVNRNSKAHEYCVTYDIPYVIIGSSDDTGEPEELTPASINYFYIDESSATFGDTINVYGSVSGGDYRIRKVQLSVFTDSTGDHGYYSASKTFSYSDNRTSYDFHGTIDIVDSFLCEAHEIYKPFHAGTAAVSVYVSVYGPNGETTWNEFGTDASDTIEIETNDTSSDMTISHTVNGRYKNGAAQVTFNVTTSTSFSSIGFYHTNGTLIKKFSGSSYYTTSNGQRNWKLTYSFSDDGYRTFRFKAFNSSGTVVNTDDYSLTLVGLKVKSAKFAKTSVSANTSVNITVKTNTGVQYLGMYAEGGNLVKKWPASGNSTVSGNVRTWNISYSFSGAGTRTMKFKGSANGKNFTAEGGATASITVTSAASSKPTVSSAAFAKSSVGVGESVKITIKTSSNAKYLHMYSESGSQAKRWAASGNSTVSGSTRTWTVYYSFSGAGSRTLTFKASADGKTTGVGKSASITVVNTVDCYYVYADDGWGTYANFNSIEFAVETDAAAKYLHLLSENGSIVETWAASGNSEVDGDYRYWNVLYKFTGSGERNLKFCASTDKKTFGEGFDVDVEIEYTCDLTKYGSAYVSSYDEYDYFVYKAASSGYYTVYTTGSCDTYGTVYSLDSEYPVYYEGIADGDDENGCNFEITFYANAGETLLIEVFDCDFEGYHYYSIIVE